MVIDNLKSIEISFDHLKIALPTIAMWVGLHPSLILPELNLIAYSIACKNYPSFKLMNAEVYVKIIDLPFVDHIRDLRHTHLGKLVKSKQKIII
jgi:DNA replicative helicase MCM subunit Mcm2 (Cdc46/Mcm family)